MVMNTSQYAHLHKARTELSKKQERRSWLLNTQRPTEKQQPILASIEATLAKLASYPGYQEAVANLLGAQTWDEYQEHWWMVKVALHLAERSLLREMEVKLPNGSKPDIRAEADLEGQLVSFYVEAKSWRFQAARRMSSTNSEFRVDTMKAKLLKQLPEDSPGVWAWDKMRDGFSGSHTLDSDGPKPGIEERKIISEVYGEVPQVAAVMFRALDGDLSLTIWTVPSSDSKWSESLVSQLVATINSAIS